MLMKRILAVLGLIVFSGLGAVAHNRSITETITSADNKFIVSATIDVKGISNSTKTDFDKIFIVLDPAGNASLAVSSIGFISKSLDLHVNYKVKTRSDIDENTSQETRRISGTVLDEGNLPIPGASVGISGTNYQATTDFEGRFVLDIPSNSKVLSVSFVGFETKVVNIENKSTINIVLKEATSQLDEIVITGYSTEKKRNITASISSVKMKDINSQPKSNVVEMLDGRLAGVQIMSDNSPGGGTSVRIRGFGSFNSNDPLVIVDGVPASNGLNGINPSDIESLQVLKDAASASIYGSRAANGVVLITTKKGGKDGKTQMQVDGYSGIQVAFNLPKMLNAQQYGDLLWQATKNDGKVPSNAIYGSDPNNATVPTYINSANTIKSGDVNWLKEIMHPAAVHSYNLSLSKGDDKAQNALSLGYFNQDGIIQHTNFDRFSARFNSSYKIKDFLTIGENFSSSYTTQVSASTNSALGGIVFEALQFPSIVPVYDINGNFAGNPINDITNPLGKLTRAKDNKQKKIQALGNVFANVELGDFTFKTSFRFGLY